MSSTLSYNTLQACWLFTGLLVSNIIRPHVLWWYQVLTKSTVDAVEQIKDTCAPAFVEQHSQLLMYPSIPVLPGVDHPWMHQIHEFVGMSRSKLIEYPAWSDNKPFVHRLYV